MKKLKLTKEQLEKLYLIDKLSQRAIATKLGIGLGSVCTYLKKFNIPARDPACGTRGKPAHNKGVARPEMQGSNHPQWQGGRFKDKFGYVHVWAGNHPNKDRRNKVLEHRLVMEKFLNRYLLKKEVVHHINGIKDDNRLENLLWFCNNNLHKAYHNYLDANNLTELNKRFYITELKEVKER